MARAAALALVLVAPLDGQSTATVTIPEGPFEMGRSHELPDDGLKWVPHILRDDRPVRTVDLHAFEMAVHEVTNGEYARFLAENSSHYSPPFYWPEGRPPEGHLDEPVANVTWTEADAYCRWRGERLPTEAQWEKACRGGLALQKYPWGGEDPEEEGERRAHFDSVRGPLAVCQFARNGYGLCDMAGNVWEWTSDLYARDYYRNGPSAEPIGASEGRYRVIRGGSWSDEAKFLTCAQRSFARPQERSPNIGFRCVRTDD